MANYFNTLNLRQQLAQLGKYLGFLAIAVCAIIFVIGLIDALWGAMNSPMARATFRVKK